MAVSGDDKDTDTQTHRTLGLETHPNDELDEDEFFSSNIESWWKVVWKRFRRHKLALFGVFIIAVFAFLAAFAPVIARSDPAELHLEVIENGQPVPPSTEFWFGTDALGRDYFARTIYGGRISLLVGVVSAGISLLIGVPLGCLAGYYGGLVDTIISRLIDILLSIPTFFLILTVNAILKPNIFNVMVILGIFGWMGTARLVRAEILKLKEQDFIQAARSLGLGNARIVFSHLLPNVLGPVIVSATLSVAQAIVTESSLSYMGLGVQEPVPSWGSMLRASQQYIVKAPWLAIIPGAMISLVVLGLNFIGDGLRDAIDPRMKT
ncbi:MAG: ABC transporter permease [Firmicutes bacterium]|jgi:peptide/nickel transport system permease protein|nr:ABC transporter permease [Candidatus Fermentithermobacillaceae bacterium]